MKTLQQLYNENPNMSEEQKTKLKRYKQRLELHKKYRESKGKK